MADKQNNTEKKKRWLGDNAQRFTGSTAINFVAMLALFIFIFTLHQIAGDTKIDVANKVVSSELPQETLELGKEPAIEGISPPVVDQAAAVIPNPSVTKAEPIGDLASDQIAKSTPTPKKVSTTPTPEKPRLDKAKTMKRVKLVGQRKRRHRPSVRDTESQVPVEELDGESARLHYISLNRGESSLGEMRSLPQSEDLDGESARLRYITENKRLADSNLTQSTPNRSQDK